MLDEEKDEETKTFALDLIKKSASTASARLQFCRLAFGAAGSAGAQIDLGDAETMARGFLEDDKTKLAWNLPRVLLPKNRVKLLLNMLLIAGQTIPRGGTLDGRSDRGGRDAWASGSRAAGAQCPRPAGGAGSARRRRRRRRRVDAHRIQPFYTGLLAQACGAQGRRWRWKARRSWSRALIARLIGDHAPAASHG